MFMSTKKPQILLTVDEDLLRRIEKFQRDKKFFSRSEAVRQLIEAGLKTKSPKKGEGNIR
jgi:metal-responsive CopG/Arc/MetJ family transcriptional regulator